MNQRQYLISIFVLAIAIIPVVYKTGQTPLNNFDEARRAVNAAEMLEDDNLLVSHYEGAPDMWGTKPSLLVALQALSMRVFGINRVSVRIPSFLFTLTLFILLVYYSAQMGKIEWGWLAVLMLATAPGFINHHGARSGDFEPLLCFWTTVLVLYFYKYLNASSPRLKHTYFAITTLGLILACLTKGIAGLLFLPGIFLYTLFNRKLPEVLRDWRLWAGALCFLLLVGGYYLLREQYNPGYLKAVWKNEIGGRYGQTLEEHQGPAHYYLMLLFRTYFMPWIMLLPLLIRVWKQKPVFFSYLASVIGIFILVISFSETKISWYLYPSLPLIALLVAPCLIEAWTFITARIPFTRKISPFPSAALFFLLLFALPYLLRFTRIEHRLDNDLEKGQIAYGLFLDQYIESTDTLYLANIGYNPHVLFQTKRLKAQGKTAYRVYPDTSLSTGTKVLICEEEALQPLQARYDIIKQGQYCSFIQIK